MNTTTKSDRKFVVAVACLICWIVMLLLIPYSGNQHDNGAFIGGTLVCSFLPLIFMFMHDLQEKNAGKNLAPESAARFICELKANGKQFVAVKSGRGYRFSPYDGNEDNRLWSYVELVEFHNIFNTIDRHSTPRVSSERMRRMGLI